MDFTYKKKYIEINDKKLTNLDKFALEFLGILNKHANYVLVSGYISILFGRNRTSEDVDVLVEKLDLEKFKHLWDEFLSKKFECINTNKAEAAYHNYLSENVAIRFSKKSTFIPNVEFKFPKVDLDYWTLRERKKILLNERYELMTSPLELQIPFKLFLGSEKDIEDAKHLYKLFKDYLDIDLLDDFNQKLKTKELFKRYLS